MPNACKQCGAPTNELECINCCNTEYDYSIIVKSWRGYSLGITDNNEAKARVSSLSTEALDQIAEAVKRPQKIEYVNKGEKTVTVGEFMRWFNIGDSDLLSFFQNKFGIEDVLLTDIIELKGKK